MVSCGNDDRAILKAAHLWEVTDIKNADKLEIERFITDNGLSGLIDATSKHSSEVFYKKYCLVNSGDNGIWLCGTHHDMFDKNYFCFESTDGCVHLLKFASKQQQDEFMNSLKDGQATKIPQTVLTLETKAFLTMRNLPFRL